MWDFLRSVSVHFGVPRPNVLKLILKSPRFVPFGGQSDPILGQRKHPSQIYTETDIENSHICPIWGQFDPIWSQKLHPWVSRTREKQQLSPVICSPIATTICAEAVVDRWIMRTSECRECHVTRHVLSCPCHAGTHVSRVKASGFCHLISCELQCHIRAQRGPDWDWLSFQSEPKCTENYSLKVRDLSI